MGENVSIGLFHRNEDDDFPFWAIKSIPWHFSTMYKVSMKIYEKVIFLGKKRKPRSQFFSLSPPQITIAIKQGFQWLKVLNFSVQSTFSTVWG